MRLFKFLVISVVLHAVILVTGAHIGGSKISTEKTIQPKNNLTLRIKKEEAQEKKVESAPQKIPKETVRAKPVTPKESARMEQKKPMETTKIEQKNIKETTPNVAERVPESSPLRLRPNQDVEPLKGSQKKLVEKIPESKPQAINHGNERVQKHLSLKEKEPQVAKRQEEVKEKQAVKEEKQPEPEKQGPIVEKKIESPVKQAPREEKNSQIAVVREEKRPAASESASHAGEVVTEGHSTNKTVQSGSVTSDFKQSYAGFLQSIDAKSIKGLPTPDLTVWYQNEKEIISVAKYFGLKFVVYEEPFEGQNPVFIEVSDPSLPKFEKSERIDLTHYSNRVRQHKEHPFFGTLLSTAVGNFNLDVNRSRLIVLVPKEVDLYFRYKQIECAKQNDIDPFSVKVTNARYYRTNLNNWILVIDTIDLRDGRTTKVEDFELKKFM